MVLLAALLALSAPPSVAVLPAAKTAEPAAHAIELRLAAHGARALRDEEIAAALATKSDPPSLDPAIAAKVKSLLDEAEKDYYDDRLEDVLARAVEARTLLDANDAAPASERVRAHLVEAAALHGRGREDEAEKAAQAALAIAPDLVVDLDVFQPSVAKFVDEARARMPALVPVLVDAPAGAEIRIDDRPVTGGKAMVVPGMHVLTMRAPGLEAWRHRFDTAAEPSVRVPVALALDRATESALESGATGASPAAAGIASLAARLHADVVVVVSLADGAARATAWRVRDGRASRVAGPIDATDPDAVAARVTSALREPRAPGFAATEPTVRGGAILISRARYVSGGGGFATHLTGAGARVESELVKGSFAATVDLAGVSFGMTQVRILLPDGNEATQLGGSSFLGRADAGVRLRLHAVALDALAGPFAEIDQATDLRDQGLALGYLPSESVFGATARLRITTALSSSLSFRASAGVGAGVLAESPSGMSGTSPSLAPFPFARAGLVVDRTHGWRAGVDVGAEERDEKFHGDSRIATQTKITGAKVREQTLTISFGVERRF